VADGYSEPILIRNARGEDLEHELELHLDEFRAAALREVTAVTQMRKVRGCMVVVLQCHINRKKIGQLVN
jgi:type IV secretory pathway TraG/TraD family ATPase VirD4